MQRLVAWIEALTEKSGQIASWLSALLVLVVCYDVFTRYMLNASSVAIQELEWHLFAAMFLLAMADGFKHNRHVRVDVLYNQFSPRVQLHINFWGTVLFLIPFALVVIWASGKFVWASFSIRETSPDPGGLPARYLLKAIIPFSFFLLLLQGVATAVQTAKRLWGKSNGGDQ